jgi:hypothetical protein
MPGLKDVKDKTGMIFAVKFTSLKWKEKIIYN